MAVTSTTEGRGNDTPGNDGSGTSDPDTSGGPSQGCNFWKLIGGAERGKDGH